MKFIERVSIVGAGNLALHLAPALEGCGTVINEVYSRTPENAKKLAKKLYKATIHPSLDFRNSKSELFILAVADQAITEVAQRIQIPEQAILVHTSGSQPLQLLQKPHTRTGVFYPMQTFSPGRKIDFKNIPIFIEANDKKVLDQLAELAYGLTPKVYDLTSQERLELHAAAVFACNLTNELFAISKELVNKIGLDFALFQPMVNEMVQKAFQLGPQTAQTGPAIRGEKTVLEAHRQHLHQKNTLYESIYTAITESIQKRNLKK